MRRVAVVGSVTVITLAGVGAAFAFFTSSGSGTGSAQVGSASWSISEDHASGTIYPGGPGETITFNVQNTSGGDQQYASETPSVNTSGGDVTVGGSPVAGCLASWFNAAASNTNVNTNIAGGATVQEQVTVSMPTNATNQDPCQGVHPDVTLSIP